MYVFVYDTYVRNRFEYMYMNIEYAIYNHVYFDYINIIYIYICNGKKKDIKKFVAKYCVSECECQEQKHNMYEHHTQ